MGDPLMTPTVDQNIVIKNSEMRSLVEMMRATVAITAAYIAHLEEDLDASSASEAIRLASFALDTLDSAASSIRLSLPKFSRNVAASAQSTASRQSGESGACPCLPCVTSSSTPAGPIDSKCASCAAESAIAGFPCADVGTAGILHGADAALPQEAQHG